jgi:hypothetical protein
MILESWSVNVTLGSRTRFESECDSVYEEQVPSMTQALRDLSRVESPEITIL